MGWRIWDHESETNFQQIWFRDMFAPVTTWSDQEDFKLIMEGEGKEASKNLLNKLPWSRYNIERRKKVWELPSESHEKIIEKGVGNNTWTFIYLYVSELCIGDKQHALDMITEDNKYSLLKFIELWQYGNQRA